MLWSHSVLWPPPSPFPTTKARCRCHHPLRMLLKGYAGDHGRKAGWTAKPALARDQARGNQSRVSTPQAQLYCLPKPTCCCLRPD